MLDVENHLLSKLFIRQWKKFLSYENVPVNKPMVLFMTPAGVAAVDVNDTTIHTDLNIQVGNF